MSKSSVKVFRTAYDGLNRDASDSYSTEVVDDGRTKQSFKSECDINNIMAKYVTTGIAKVRSDYQSGAFKDLASVPDFHTAHNILSRAQQSFDALPSSLRKRFHNDPAEFLGFVADPKNRDELESLGMAKPRPPAEPLAAASSAAASPAPKAPMATNTAPAPTPESKFSHNRA